MDVMSLSELIASSIPVGGIIGIVLGSVALIAIIIIIWYISTRNSLIALKNDVEEAYSTMDVHMKKRYDLIPNLLETCKGYTLYESQTLLKVTQARNSCLNAELADKADAERELGSSLRTFFHAVSESYPELKADGQFAALSKQLEQCEHEIAQARKYYNAKIKNLNNKIEMFPSSIVARQMRLERRKLFEIDEAERETPKINFDGISDKNR